MNTICWFLVLLGALPTLVLGVLLVRLTPKTRWKIAVGAMLLFFGGCVVGFWNYKS